MTTRDVRGVVLWTLLLLGSVLSLYVSYRIATHSIILGSREGGWVYPYIHAFSIQPVAMFLLVSLLVASVFAVQDVLARDREWVMVALWIVAATVLQGLLRKLTPYTLEHIFISDGANAFYGVARHYTAGTVMAEFDRVRAYWPLHARSNMPGKLMLVYALKHISKDPRILPWLVVLASNLGGVLMYLFVRDLFGDRRIARFSLVLYFFVPAKLFFFPLMNVVTPVLVLGCAVLVLRWLLTGNPAYPAMLGAVLYALVFFEPSPLVMGLLFIALAGRAMSRSDVSPRRLLVQSGIMILAFAATYASVFVGYGFDLFRALRQIAAHAAAFNIEAGRPYSVWVRANLLEFFFGVGLCQSVLFFAALGVGLWNGQSWRERLTDPITMLCLALAAVLLSIDLIGVNRAEVVRLWIFLACFFQIPASYVCARLGRRSGIALALVVGTTLLQAALGTSMIGFIVP